MPILASNGGEGDTQKLEYSTSYDNMVEIASISCTSTADQPCSFVLLVLRLTQKKLQGRIEKRSALTLSKIRRSENTPIR